MKLVPASVFLTSGVGVHRHRLSAFEFALRDADIEQQSLVSVSSILPPLPVPLRHSTKVSFLLATLREVCVPAGGRTRPLSTKVFPSKI